MQRVSATSGGSSFQVRAVRPKRCKQCKRPVGKTRGGLGFCKACLKEALRVQNREPVANRGLGPALRHVAR